MSTFRREPDDEAEEPTALERMGLPFLVEDDLVEPLPRQFIVHVHFAAPVTAGAMQALERLVERWLQQQPALASPPPAGEVVQVGAQSVELRIDDVQGDPDTVLPTLLLDLEKLARVEPIARVALD